MLFKLLVICFLSLCTANNQQAFDNGNYNQINYQELQSNESQIVPTEPEDFQIEDTECQDRQTEEAIENLNRTMEKKIGELTSQMKNLIKSQKHEADMQRKQIQNQMDKLNDTLGKRIEELSSDLTETQKQEKEKQQKETQNWRDELEDSMEKTIDQMKTDLETKMQEVKEELIEEIQESKVAVLKRQGFCDVQYNNLCFWAIVHDVRDVNYAEVERLCKESGGQVADIYDQAHYDVIVQYLRTKIPSSRSFIEIWIANRINPYTRTITGRNGVKAFGTWFPGDPIVHSSRTWMIVNVNRNPTYRSQGMGNWPSDRENNGVVCEI